MSKSKLTFSQLVPGAVLLVTVKTKSEKIKVSDIVSRGSVMKLLLDKGENSILQTAGVKMTTAHADVNDSITVGSTTFTILSNGVVQAEGPAEEKE